MYNVLLNREILQSAGGFSSEFFSVPEDLLDTAEVPAGFLEFIRALIGRIEADWDKEKAEFQRCYRLQHRLENGVWDLITRMTVAAEQLVKCNYVITYRADVATAGGIRAMRQPFIDETCRLYRLITGVIDALQLKDLANEVENPKPDLCLRGDDLELLFVRKLRMSYAEHLAGMCVRLHEIYSAALPAEVQAVRLRARVFRNMAALLIDLARADEAYQAGWNESFGKKQ